MFSVRTMLIHFSSHKSMLRSNSYIVLFNVDTMDVHTVIIAKFNSQFMLHCSMLVQLPLQSSMLSSCYIVQCWYSYHCKVQCSVQMVTLFNVDTMHADTFLITKFNAQFLVQSSILIKFSLQSSMHSSCYSLQY